MRKGRRRSKGGRRTPQRHEPRRRRLPGTVPPIAVTTHARSIVSPVIAARLP